MKVLIAYDGTLHSKTALRYGLEKVRETGGELIALHVFNSNLFIDYDALPEAEEIAKKESSRYIEEVETIIRTEGTGMRSSIIETEGNPEKEIIRYAATENVNIIFSPPRYKSIVKKAPCPVSIIPGTIVVPVDNNDESIAGIDQIVKEAKAICSKVLLLGLIPIHIYNKWEREEIKKIKLETSATLKRFKKMLEEKGIETEGIIRSGYPDEEIAKIAGEISLSMIVFFTGSHKPSELSKAINIILDESNRIKVPVVSLMAEGAVSYN